MNLKDISRNLNHGYFGLEQVINYKCTLICVT